MANEHHSTFKLVNGFCQSVDGLDVQVIGRLVEEQHVGVLPRQPGEADATLLTVRQVPDGTDLKESGSEDVYLAQALER